MKKSALLFSVLILLGSCGGGGGGDDDPAISRSAFLGSWNFISVFTCTPPGTPVDREDEFEITKGEASLSLIITFASGLVLSASAVSESSLGITYETIDGISYGGNGVINAEGDLELMITQDLGEGNPYCVQDGVAVAI